MAWWNKLKKKGNPPAVKAYDTKPYDYQPYLLEFGPMYAQQAHVHLAVDMVSQAVAVGQSEVFFGEQRVVDHPFLDLLKNPNPVVDGFQFLEATASDYQIFGNAYWWMRGGSDGRPAELWRLRPDRVKRIPKTGEYVYVLDTERVVFHPAEIMHLSSYSATDDWFGDSRLTGARLEISTDYAMALYQNKFFGKNVAVPAGMWLLPESLSADKYQETKAEIEEMYGGDRRTAVVRASVDGEPVSFVAAGLKQEDMAFTEGRKFNRQVIYETMGIPTGMLSESSTEAHARVSERRFNEGIYYFHVRLAAAINKNVMPFYGTGQEFRFKDVRTIDKDVLQSASKNQVQGVENGQSTSEIRSSGVESSGANRGLSGGFYWPSSPGLVQPILHR
jgi:HK97 family phage portal protein